MSFLFVVRIVYMVVSNGMDASKEGFHGHEDDTVFGEIWVCWQVKRSS